MLAGLPTFIFSFFVIFTLRSHFIFLFSDEFYDERELERYAYFNDVQCSMYRMNECIRAAKIDIYANSSNVCTSRSSHGTVYHACTLIQITP